MSTAVISAVATIVVAVVGAWAARSAAGRAARAQREAAMMAPYAVLVERVTALEESHKEDQRGIRRLEAAHEEDQRELLGCAESIATLRHVLIRHVWPLMQWVDLGAPPPPPAVAQELRDLMADIRNS